MQLTLNLWTVLTVVMIGAPIILILGSLTQIKKGWARMDVEAAWPVFWRFFLATSFCAAVTIACSLKAVAADASGSQGIAVFWGVTAVVTGVSALFLAIAGGIRTEEEL